MAYLTYIIDHYPTFPDVVLFFHPHKTAWHNNIMHDISTPTTILRLKDEHVIRQGYFNTRCHLDPGCPNWLHVDRWPIFFSLRYKPEEPFLTSKLFHEMHGKEVSVPKAISQPCCAQFAVSGQRLAERPLSDYVHYRDWILNTELKDETSGRLMEYSWQYIFGGKFEYCPGMHGCYCSGYGVCFEGGEEGIKAWLKILKKRERVDEKRMLLWDAGVEAREGERYRLLTVESNELQRELERLKGEAMRRGEVEWVRAESVGRVG